MGSPSGPCRRVSCPGSRPGSSHSCTTRSLSRQGSVAEEAERLRTLEREALKTASAVIVTSDTTAAHPRCGLRCAPRGDCRCRSWNGAGASGGRQRNGRCDPRRWLRHSPERLRGSGGRLARLRDRPWSLTIVGALDRAPDYVQSLRAQIDAVGLSDRIRFTGAVSGSCAALAV